MNKRTNCKNCGAPLYYDNNLATCSYCGTEYHLDHNGRIEEYKVTLNILGEDKQFYISEMEYLYPEFGFEYVESMISIRREPKIRLELISY